MRTINIFISFFFVSLALCAGPVDIEHASSVAKEFLSAKGRTLSMPDNVARSQKFGKTQSQSPYYVFNADNNQGFVIVSGDDRAVPILGYSERGSFDVEQIPDNMRAWLQGYEDQIKQLDQIPDANSVPQTRAVQSTVHKTRHTVKPLIESKWGQSFPYNYKCPSYHNEDGTLGGKSLTGCVATVMAQIMNYYKYPDKLLDTIPQSVQVSETDTIILPAVPKGTIIDWNNIRNNYIDHITYEEVDALSNLMLYVGQSAKTQFGMASSAFLDKSAYALKHYFGYDDGVKVFLHNYYTHEEWEDLIYNEIVEGRPVSFGGQSNGYDHNFILDGYDGNNYFHVNWGWNGFYDGYFLLTAIYPNANDYFSATNIFAYTMSQMFIGGIKLPDDIPAEDTSVLQTIPYGISNDHLIFKFVNISSEIVNYDVALGEEDDDGTLHYLGGLQSVTCDDYSSYKKSFAVPALPIGRHKLVMLNRAHGFQVWKSGMLPYEEYFIAEVYGEDSMKLRKCYNPRNLVVDSFSVLTNQLAGYEQYVKLSFHNLSQTFVNDDFRCYVSKTDDKGQLCSQLALSMDSDETQTAIFSFLPEEAGTYNLWIISTEREDSFIYHTTLDIKQPQFDTPELQVCSLSIRNRSGNNVYGNSIIADAVIRNNRPDLFLGNVFIDCLIYDEQEDEYVLYKFLQLMMHVPPKQSVTYTVKFDDLKQNCKYQLRCEYYSPVEYLKDGIQETPVTLLPGVTCYLDDGSCIVKEPLPEFCVDSNAIAVDFRDIENVTNVTQLSNAENCLYIFDSGTKIPTAIASKNIVVDGKIGTLNLKDDAYGFYTPIDIEAERVTYSRVLTQGFDGKAWETLTLPFVPTETALDGKSVAIRSAQNDSGVVIVKTLASETDNGQLSFGYPTQLISEEPYIFSVEGAQPNQTLTFGATHATLKSNEGGIVASTTGHYTFKGTYHNTLQSEIYRLNDAGTAFCYVEDTVQSAPFRAYFVTQYSEAARLATIVIPEEKPTALEPVLSDGEETFPVMSLDGMEVGVARRVNGEMLLPKLKHGIYVVDGKKYVR